jgi:outer membrane immunogenic protein
MTNRCLGSLALAAMMAAPAMAADLPYTPPPPPPPAAYYDWSGAYLGVNVGGAAL